MYPTMQQVRTADREQLGRWYRFLPSPGTSAIERDDFHQVRKAEKQVMTKIVARFKELGGMTPELSKAIGWGDRTIAP